MININSSEEGHLLIEVLTRFDFAIKVRDINSHGVAQCIVTSDCEDVRVIININHLPHVEDDSGVEKLEAWSRHLTSLIEARKSLVCQSISQQIDQYENL